MLLICCSNEFEKLSCIYRSLNACGYLLAHICMSTHTHTLTCTQWSLRLDPNDRPTCSQLLRHELFTKGGWSEKFSTDLRTKIEKEIDENPLLKNLGITIHGSVHDAKNRTSQAAASGANEQSAHQHHHHHHHHRSKKVGSCHTHTHPSYIHTSQVTHTHTHIYTYTHSHTQHTLEVSGYTTGGLSSGTEAIASDIEGVAGRKEKKKKKIKNKELLHHREKALPEKIKSKFSCLSLTHSL